MRVILIVPETAIASDNVLVQTKIRSHWFAGNTIFWMSAVGTSPRGRQ